MGIFSRSLICDPTTELTGTIGDWALIVTFPDGVISFREARAATTSSGDRWLALRRSGSARMTMVRWLPPKGGGAETPGRAANMGRTLNRARFWISPMPRVLL